MNRLASAALVLALGAASCAAPPAGIEPKHIVMLSRKGRLEKLAEPARQRPFVLATQAVDDPALDGLPAAVLPSASPPPAATPEGPASAEVAVVKRPSEDLIDGVIDGIRESGKRRVVLFVHGGLNSRLNTFRRAERTAAIMGDGSYPVFIGWNSSLLSSYLKEHLFLTREGKEWPLVSGALGAPVVLLGDAARGVTRAPYVWLLELGTVADTLTDSDVRLVRWFRRAVRGVLPTFEPEEDEVAHRTAELLRDSRMQISVPPRSALGPRWFHAIRWTFWLPVRLVASPFIEGAGAAAWSVMKRRTRLLVHREREFLEKPGRLQELRPCETATTGPNSRQICAPETPLRVFLRKLAGLQKEREQQGERLEVVLVGHSMGALIVNEILRFDQTQAATQQGAIPRFDHIVYMASAASVRDYLDSAIPYLRSNPQTRVHHLMLDERAELNERFPNVPIGHYGTPFDWLAPGSLLVWVDSFLESPATLLDRTAGRYVNLMHSVRYTPQEVQSRVEIRVFPWQDGYPQAHGDFSSADYWKPSFWFPDDTPTADAGRPAP